MTLTDVLQLVGAALGGGTLVQVANALLRKDSIAVLTADKALDLATKAFDRERELWAAERSELVRRIEKLEAEVAKLRGE